MDVVISLCRLIVSVRTGMPPNCLLLGYICSPMSTSTLATATLYDAAEYRRRKALRDCGQRSQRREFLWVYPGSVVASVAVFLPARPNAADMLHSARVTARFGG